MSSAVYTDELVEEEKSSKIMGREEMGQKNFNFKYDE